MYFHHLQQIVKLATLQLVTRSHWSLAVRLLSGGPIDSDGAPILFIAKPDGGLRVVCDYRMLNKLTINNRYPLPRIDELLAHIGGKIIFSSLDLLDGTKLQLRPRINTKRRLQPRLGIMNSKSLLKVSRIPPRLSKKS